MVAVSEKKTKRKSLVLLNDIKIGKIELRLYAKRDKCLEKRKNCYISFKEVNISKH